MSNNVRQFDLENRLVDFAVRVINVVEALPDTRAGKQNRLFSFNRFCR